MDKLYVIGIGPRCLDEEAREIISSWLLPQKDIWKGCRVQGVFPISPLKDALDFIRENLGRKRMGFEVAQCVDNHRDALH